MLIRPRRSRIYYLRKFFDYPITLTANTLKNLGVIRMARVGTSYMVSRVHQIKPEKSLEDFLINRFGRELYLTFFKSYTEKVWGTPCHEISAEWGAQRIKGLSLTTAVKHFLKKAFSRKQSGELAQKGTETSLIERFMYPKFGPGQLWEHVADLIRQRGGEIYMGWRVDQLNFAEARTARRLHRGPIVRRRAAYLCRRLLLLHHARAGTDRALRTPVPANVKEVQRRPALPRLYHRRSARRKAEGEGTGRRRCLKTTGSTFRSRMCCWDGCRSSITGAPIWLAIPARSGSASSISATTPTTCGRCRTTS